MKLAFFGGLYSNYLALEVAIADARRRDVQELFCLGTIELRLAGDLDRHRTVQFAVEVLVDGAEGAHADLVDQVKVADRASRRVILRESFEVLGKVEMAAAGPAVVVEGLVALDGLDRVLA